MIKFFLLILIPFALTAETSLWKISHGSNSLFIGGTIHLLRPSDYPLPTEFDSAYSHCDKLVLETNLSDMNSESFQNKLINAVTLPKGESLKTILRPEVYTKITNHLTAKGVPPTSLDNLRPSMASIMITQWEMGKYEMAEDGVDLHYFKKSQNDHKKTIELETNDQQIQYIANLGNDDPNGLILNSLDETSDMSTLIEGMTSAWKTGDQEKLYETVLKDMITECPSMYKSLIVDRNNNWIPQIESMIKSKSVELILVGAGHLIGTDGVLQKLQNLGYTVKQATFKGNSK